MKDLANRAKNQFNKQAKNFSNWSVTQNREYLQAYFDFLGPDPEETLLDVACGTGELSVFAASMLKKVSGVDISEAMIERAGKTAADLKIPNVNFYCQNIENLQVEIELDFTEYVSHAKQTKEDRAGIDALLQSGLEDFEISKCFTKREEGLFFKRNVFLIMGENRVQTS